MPHVRHIPPQAAHGVTMTEEDRRKILWAEHDETFESIAVEDGEYERRPHIVRGCFHKKRVLSEDIESGHDSQE